jgi:hypothetical protein
MPDHTSKTTAPAALQTAGKAVTGNPFVDNPASWVIRDKSNGDVLLETFDTKKVDALNTEKYEAVPIIEHLGSINKAIQEKPILEKIGATEQQIYLEKRMAAALGYVDVELSLRGELVGRLPGEKTRTYLPRWTRDNGAAHSLAVANKLSVGYMGHEESRGERRAVSDQTRLWAIAYTGDYKFDDEATVNAAIVMAAATKLEHEANFNVARPAAAGPSLG